MKLETKHKEIIWCIILSLGLIIFFATGCKPKEILHVRTVTAIDSTAVLNLSSEVSKLTKENATLKTNLERFREEIIKLRSEVSKHEINYNTDAPLKPDGYYPIKEYEKEISELNKELQQTATKNINLEQTVEKLTSENKDLKTKINAFNLNSFLWGILAGVILIIIIKVLL